MVSPQAAQAEKWGKWSRRPPPIDAHATTFQNVDICHHSNGNKLHKVQESAASIVGDKHQAGKE